MLSILIPFMASIALARGASGVAPYTLPIGAANTTARAQAIANTRVNFTYGPDIVGGGPYYPTGPLAQQMITVMGNEFFPQQEAWVAQVQADGSATVATIIAVSPQPLEMEQLTETL